MKAGELDRRIQIQENTTTTADDAGEFVPVWANLTGGAVWASLEDQPGNETEEADQRVSVSRTVWIIRYLSTLDETMRIVYGGKNYYIISIQEQGRKEGMRVITELRDN